MPERHDQSSPDACWDKDAEIDDPTNPPWTVYLRSLAFARANLREAENEVEAAEGGVNESREQLKRALHIAASAGEISPGERETLSAYADVDNIAQADQ